jgi:CheY-like chemotaxis protein
MPVIPVDEQLEVLLVDDELSTRELLEQFCRSRNLVVTAAADGRAAITALQRSPTRFTIVLTDINMPGADGFEVLKTARGCNRSCYVIMITGYATLDSALRAVREGAYDYLAKPFSMAQLDVMLARIKDRMALEREIQDLRRRLGGRAGSPAASPGSMLYPSAVAPIAAAAVQPAAAPAGAAASRTIASLQAVVAPVQPAASAPVAVAPDLSQRVGTMEDRLGKIEELLRAALEPAPARFGRRATDERPSIKAVR